MCEQANLGKKLILIVNFNIFGTLVKDVLVGNLNITLIVIVD